MRRITACLFYEIARRDGFQIEPRWVETADKVRFLNALSGAGFAKIEFSFFVSPRSIPNLRDVEELFARIKRSEGVTYSALVPNVRGAETKSPYPSTLYSCMLVSQSH